MCGITGVADFGAPLAAPESKQLRVLHHRGPDAAAWFSAGAAMIGQNRLAIIDLVTGDPPITNETGTIGVVLNGEIYNFRELRATLTERGHDLRTAGDSEVIAHLAEDYEPVELARQLEGMFAAAVWDPGRQRLLLLRDRMGKKPLYYWTNGQRLVFGSEIKAVLCDPAVPRRLNAVAIPAYLTFGYVPTPQTFFEGVHCVPPGCVLTFTPHERVRIEQYWKLPCPGIDVEYVRGTPEEITDEVRRLLRQAVRRRLISDVPLGAFLSGGIDSSALVGIMSELVDRPVRTFTIGFEDGEGFDERPFARRIAERFRTEHQEFVVHPHSIDIIEQLIWHHDQPFGDSSAVPMFLLSELARQHVTVALAGDGGDELFAGYERFAAALAVRGYQRAPLALRTAGSRVLNRFPPTGLRGRIGSAQRFSARADLPLPDAYLSWLSYVDDDWHRRLSRNDHDWGRLDYQRRWADTEGAAQLDRLLHLNFRTYLLDDLLVKVDRMSMANGLEVRSPFLDRELVEFAARIPPTLKVRGPWLKWILKRAVDDLIPIDLLHRRKRGFGVPLMRWFREDIASYVNGTLGARDARIREHLVGSELDVLLLEHQSGRRDHGHALWALLTLELFLRREGW